MENKKAEGGNRDIKKPVETLYAVYGEEEAAYGTIGGCVYE